MDGAQLFVIKFSEHVDRLADHIQKAALHLVAGRHGYRALKVSHLHAAAHAVGTFHGHAADDVLADVLLYFEDQLLPVVTLYLESRIDGRNVLLTAFERDVDHRANHLGHRSINFAHICFNF